MTEDARDVVAVAVAEFMIRYSFELGGYRLEQWIRQWLADYPALWVRSAVIEALYQGRYKAFSVSQILDLWRRRGQPLQHFNREFERIVAGHSLPTWLGESATRTRESRPEPVLIATDATRLTFTPNGMSRPEESNGQVIVAAPLQIQRWQSTRPEHAADQASIDDPPNSLLERNSSRPSTSIQPFQPSSDFHLTLPDEIRRTSAQLPIQQFIPAADSSELHDKLRAIAQSLLLNQAQAVTVVLQTAKSVGDLESELLSSEPDQTPSEPPQSELTEPPPENPV